MPPKKTKTKYPPKVKIREMDESEGLWSGAIDDPEGLAPPASDRPARWAFIVYYGDEEPNYEAMFLTDAEMNALEEALVKDGNFGKELEEAKQKAIDNATRATDAEVKLSQTAEELGDAIGEIADLKDLLEQSELKVRQLETNLDGQRDTVEQAEEQIDELKAVISGSIAAQGKPNVVTSLSMFAKMAMAAARRPDLTAVELLDMFSKDFE